MWWTMNKEINIIKYLVWQQVDTHIRRKISIYVEVYVTKDINKLVWDQVVRQVWGQVYEQVKH